MAIRLDAQVINQGTIFQVWPNTKRARKWIEEHVDLENAQWFGPTLIVEHRYINDLVMGMRDDGLKVEA